MRWASNGFLFFSLLSTGLLACGGPPPTGAPRLTLRAAFDDGQPTAGATVVLNEEDVGQTDSTGRLSLDVSPGSYTARLRLETGGGRESRTERSIDMGASSQEVTVTLPRPLQWREPLELTTSRVHLSWEPSTEAGFSEYRIYASAYAPAVDEKSGRLVYEWTQVSQTEFVLTGLMDGGSPFVTAGEDLYFRLLVLKEDGSLSRSNVLHVKTPSWDNEAHFTRFYTLSVERQFAGTQPIQGIAYDGTALWLLYYVKQGGYYDKGQGTLARLDPATRKVLQQLSFEDRRAPFGLAWDGQLLWVSLEGQLVGFNPSTGVQEKTFASSPSTASMAWSGSQILQSVRSIGAQIHGIDPTTGEVSSFRPNPFTQFGPHYAQGIAARPGETWVSDRYMNDLAIVDDAGVHIGVVKESSHFTHMTFMGEKLVGVTPYSQVVILSIQEAPRPP